MPKSLIKERNFELKVKLVLNDKNKEFTKNGTWIVDLGNLLNLYIGVFDNLGEWVTENRVNQPILRGKTEVQLFNGEAIFNKIYFREISSLFEGETLNLVVYARASSIEYETIDILSEKVQWNEVQPLFIRNIRVYSRRFPEKAHWTYHIIIIIST